MKKFLNTSYDKIWEMLENEIDMEESVYNETATIKVEDEYYKFVLEHIEFQESVEYDSGCDVYSVSVYTMDGEFLEDLDLYVKQYVEKTVTYDFDDDLDLRYNFDKAFRVSSLYGNDY